jgi:FkbH-like protein
MVPSVTEESAQRTDLVKAQLGRDHERAAAADPGAFLASLKVQVVVERPSTEAQIARIAELFQRTTQFNTTGRTFSEGELIRRAEAGDVFIAHCSDRFGDYGLVAAVVVEGGEIIGFVMSCRVIGLGVERGLLGVVLETLAEAQGEVTARIVETPRNGPVRHLYADAGFALDGEIWRRKL